MLQLTSFRSHSIAASVVAVMAVLSGPALAQAQDTQERPKLDVIYVPTPQEVVDRMLEMAQVKSTDFVIDLGCGDGRNVVTAAQKFGSRGFGVDIDPARIKDSLETMRKFGVTKEQVDIRQGDALKVKDLDRATVVMLYMLPEFMEKLEPQIKKLRPGTRIVAHDYPFPNLEPDEVVEFQTGGTRARFLYRWTVRDKK